MSHSTRLALAALAMAAGLACAAPPAAALEPGMRLLPFELENLAGEKASIEKLRANAKLTVIVFWATWSKSSLRELDELAKLAKLQEKGLRVVCINAESEKPDAAQVAAARAAAKELPAGFTVLFDAGLSTFRDYTVYAIPTTFIADRNGVVVFRLAGFPIIGGQRMLTFIREKLEGRPFNPGPWAYRPKPRAVRYYNLARILLRKGDLEMASHTLRRAAEIDPQYTRPHILLGDLDRNAGRYDEALVHYNHALEADAKNAEVLSLTGLCHLLAGRIDDGLAQIQLALAEDDSNALASARLAFGLALQGNQDEATDEFEKALALAPRDHRIHELQAMAYERRGMKAEAVAAYWRAYDLLVPAAERARGASTEVKAGTEERRR